MAQVKEQVQKWNPNPVQENGTVQHNTLGQLRDSVSPEPLLPAGKIELQVVPKVSNAEEKEVGAPPVCALEVPAVADELQKGGDVQGGGFAAADELEADHEIRITVSSRIAAIEKEVRGIAAANGDQSSAASFRTWFIPVGVQPEAESTVQNSLSSAAERSSSPSLKLHEQNVEAKTGRQEHGRRIAAIPKDTGGAQHVGSVRTIFSALGVAEQEALAVQNATVQQKKLPAEIGGVATGGHEALDRGKGSLAKLPSGNVGRGTGQLRNAIAKGSRSPRNNNNNPSPGPAWTSSTKLTVATATSPSPKKVVTPTKHGLKMKKAAATTSKEVKASSSNLRTTTSHEIRITDYRRPKAIACSNLVSKSLDSTANPGSFCQVPVSPFFSNGGHDAAASSKLITESILLSPSLEGKDQSAAAAPLQLDSKSFATVNTSNTNNGSETIEDQLQEDDDDDEDKVALMCTSSSTSSVAETNRLSGDLGRLLGSVYGKLRWSSSGSEANTKSSSRRSSTSSSNQRIISKGVGVGGGVKLLQTSSSRQSSLGCSSGSLGAQKFEIGSHTSLKLLQERCSIELKDSASKATGTTHNKKKTRDLGPHRHYYRGITTKLEQKLK
ncbi:unnamed protein product [Sphagnum troendelagicum]|uniref:Uncharacterized protein n=1 Tax=Sphagnum troendelagicum TaxID=128251 RepID=A0ABP0ULQ9_9BRYO